MFHEYTNLELSYIYTILTLLAASVNAYRGSGQTKGILNSLMKWFVIPGLMMETVLFASNNLYLAVASALPFMWFMGTGTGGCHQAQWYTTSNHPQETKYLDEAADWLAQKWILLMDLDLDYSTYCRTWGFMYSSFVGIFFTLPFLLTNYLYALPCLLFPVACRYLEWRQVEFLTVFVFLELLIRSL